MPTYQYECKECEHSFEIFQSIHDEPVDACPECGAEVTKVVNFGGGIVFKGKGFYSTDNRKRKRF